MSNLTQEERGCIALPAEVHSHTCRKCGGPQNVLFDSLSADEGNGNAGISLECCDDNCECQSYFSWPLPDSEYEALFGHAFGEDREDDEGQY